MTPGSLIVNSMGKNVYETVDLRFFRRSIVSFSNCSHRIEANNIMLVTAQMWPSDVMLAIFADGAGWITSDSIVMSVPPTFKE